MEEHKKSSDQSTSILLLDQDIVSDIFTRLAVKPLLQFRSISKPFLSVIQDPLFIKAHLAKTISNPKNLIFFYYESFFSRHRYFFIFNLDRDTKTFFRDKKIEFPFQSEKGFVRMVGSSNGLICFFNTDYHSHSGKLFLWNPLLQRFKVLPDLDMSSRAYSHRVVGFTYVSEINDFKTLQILYTTESADTNWQVNTAAFVYTLAGNCWRKIDILVPCYIPKYLSENVFANGSVHWLACSELDSLQIMDGIMFFDMNKEIFGEFALPNDIGRNYGFKKLSTSCIENNTLSLFSLSDDNKWVIWVMKEYGMVESWIRVYSGDDTLFTYPLRFIHNKSVCAIKSSNLVFLNFEEEPEYERTEIRGATCSFYAVDYTESLALLDNGDQLQVKNLN